ncbi:hypothetical protein B0T20DRAFT_396458 [Sordaria brevicollis]|uniref:Uncharacterized protein n=1 Tax=Sordaria brevicollis TaxID=83679 RepID=A0AAE0P279_SORBR|nr:hypothetical protein B0T20DRAFT_396458 [Sordaria brevicollis]
MCWLVRVVYVQYMLCGCVKELKYPDIKYRPEEGPKSTCVCPTEKLVHDAPPEEVEEPINLDWTICIQHYNLLEKESRDGKFVPSAVKWCEGWGFVLGGRVESFTLVFDGCTYVELRINGLSVLCVMLEAMAESVFDIEGWDRAGVKGLAHARHKRRSESKLNVVGRTASFFHGFYDEHQGFKDLEKSGDAADYHEAGCWVDFHCLSGATAATAAAAAAATAGVFDVIVLLNSVFEDCRFWSLLYPLSCPSSCFPASWFQSHRCLPLYSHGIFPAR